MPWFDFETNEVGVPLFMLHAGLNDWERPGDEAASWFHQPLWQSRNGVSNSFR